MGFLDELSHSSKRFQHEKTFGELAVGFDYRPINWIIEFDSNPEKLILKKYKEKIFRSVPMRADRSGKITKNNIKPNLFADNARYALGLVSGTTKKKAFNAFKDLHEKALNVLSDIKVCPGIGNEEEVKKVREELEIITSFLRLPQQERNNHLTGAKVVTPNQDKTQKKKKKAVKAKTPEPSEVVAFATSYRYLFDSKYAKLFWKQHLRNVCSDETGDCSVCGMEDQHLLRILPFKIRLFGERCPILSVNTEEQRSFGSLGKDQLGNSPICIECAGKADRALKFLTKLDKNSEGKEKNSGRHAVILARDGSKGKGKQPLRNQIAVFWTRELIELPVNDEEKITFEELAKCPLENFDEIPDNKIPVKADQFREILKAPFAGGRNRTNLPTNRFFLAILSPNKSRLVVREWLDTDVGQVSENISRYMDSLQIIHPDGRGVWAPPLPAMLEALQSYTSVKQKGKEGPRISALGPDVTRKLIRCIYTGTPPPESLLHRALRCFRVPDPSTDDTTLGKEQKDRQMLRRMAMAAAMKLVLTHNDNNKKEREAMEQSKTDHDKKSTYKKKAPYNCGRLLAVLEAIQRRASSSGRGVNTTLVDRFYGTASTAPATVFAGLLSMATKAHLPKLRREGKEIFRIREETVNINDVMAGVCKTIDKAGGFPPPLKPEQQAQFALGFYHQRAELITHKSSKNT